MEFPKIEEGDVVMNKEGRYYKVLKVYEKSIYGMDCRGSNSTLDKIQIKFAWRKGVELKRDQKENGQK